MKSSEITSLIKLFDEQNIQYFAGITQRNFDWTKVEVEHYWECLINNIMPFYIEDRNKEFYIRGLKEYQINNEKGYLIDTCLNSQDNYEKLAKFFLEDNE